MKAFHLNILKKFPEAQMAILSESHLMSVSNSTSAHAQHVGYFIYLTFDYAQFKLATVAPDKVGATLLLEVWAKFT